ncbi:MAG: class I SAM-dependent methyltransferase [Patescibacteria group bacterium]|jgi:SAM-dependent methyltransferase
MEILKIIKNFLFKNYSPDIAFRYLPVIDILNKNKLQNSNIIEVGSGDTGLTRYLKKKITGVDISFEDENSSGLLKKIKITGIGLPFPDDEFEVAISVDSLEHIEKDNRREFIKEIVRVARKYLIIVVPSGRASLEQDKKLDKQFYDIYKYHDKFLSDHLTNGLPDEQELKILFNQDFWDKKLSIVSLEKLTNLQIRDFYMSCKISKNPIRKFIYYLFLLCLPIKKMLNFGACYRQIIFIKIN